MAEEHKKPIICLPPFLRMSWIWVLCLGLASTIGRAQPLVSASGGVDESRPFVSGVISSAIACLSAGEEAWLADGADVCPSNGVVALRWKGEASRARLVLRTTGATAPHSILVNGKLVVDNIGESPAILLQSHGVFTVGADATAAVKAAVMVEDVARTVHFARQLGDPFIIPDEDVRKLRKRYTEVYGQ